MNDYIALTKPRITWLILMSTGVGYFFGLEHRWNGWTELVTLFNTIVGTALIASGTAALNQWYERESDRKMRRTEKRPLPTGALTPASALWFGIALAALGFADLAIFVNLLCACLGLLTLILYLFV